MTNFVHINICEIDDPDFQAMVAELRHAVGWDTEGFDEVVKRPLSSLLMMIGREKKLLTTQHLAVNGILTTKVDKLRFDSVVSGVCEELARLKNRNVECFDGKTVLSLIKHCYKVFSRTAARAKKPNSKERKYQFATELIKSRRRNGDL